MIPHITLIHVVIMLVLLILTLVSWMIEYKAKYLKWKLFAQKLYHENSKSLFPGYFFETDEKLRREIVIEWYREDGKSESEIELIFKNHKEKQNQSTHS